MLYLKLVYELKCEAKTRKNSTNLLDSKLILVLLLSFFFVSIFVPYCFSWKIFQIRTMPWIFKISQPDWTWSLSSLQSSWSWTIVARVPDSLLCLTVWQEVWQPGLQQRLWGRGSWGPCQFRGRVSIRGNALGENSGFSLLGWPCGSQSGGKIQMIL